MQRAEGRSPYETDADATDRMAADERIHGEVLRGSCRVAVNSCPERCRAAVFGANDGLVSNLALVLDRGHWCRCTHDLVHRPRRPAGRSAVHGRGGVCVGPVCSVSFSSRLIPTRSRSRRCHLDVDANELALVYRARGMQPPEEGMHVRCWPRCTWMPSTGGGQSTREAVGSAWARPLQLLLLRFRPGAGAAVPVRCLRVDCGSDRHRAGRDRAARHRCGRRSAVRRVAAQAGAACHRLRRMRPPISWAVRSVPPWVKRVSCSGPPQRAEALKEDFNDDARRRTASWVLTPRTLPAAPRDLLLLHRSGEVRPMVRGARPTSHRRRGCRSTRDRVGGLRGDGVGPRRIGDSVRTQVRNNRPAHDSGFVFPTRPTTSR